MGVRIRWVGSRPRLWRSVIKELAIAEQMTTNNDVITINYCVNYGGRTEIAEATQRNRQRGRGRQAQPGPDHRGHDRQPPAPARHSRCRSVYADFGGAAVQQLHVVAGGLR